MKKSFITRLSILLSVVIFTSCQNNTTGKADTEADSTPQQTTRPPLREKVLTAEEQQALTSDAVIAALKEGNNRFISNNITARDHSEMVRNAAAAQFPKAVVISCIDSRIPVEDVFDRGIGDIFVGRVAGNFVNVDLLGSLEYGCKVSGAKLILVLGHESCGAIKACIDKVKLGNITAMLTNIAPAVARSKNFNGEKTSKNEAFVELVAKNNILNTIETIKAQSPILKRMAEEGAIKIVGAYYELRSGKVIFL